MEGAGSVGRQLCGHKECPFRGVTSSGRVWRKVLESDAGSVGQPMTDRQTDRQTQRECVCVCIDNQFWKSLEEGAGKLESYAGSVGQPMKSTG